MSTKKKRFPYPPPGGVFVATLRRGRKCYDHAGTKITVLSVGEGSVLVTRRGDDITISPETVVFTNKKRVTRA